MDTNVLSKIKLAKTPVVVFDIDGTLKDLCAEHENALLNTLKEFNIGRKREKIILAINKIGMSLVKTGIFPTNNLNQRLLVLIFALFSLRSVRKFVNRYYTNYSKQICLFHGEQELLDTLKTDKQIYFSTINKQNYNLEECGIPQERIIYSTGILKCMTYKKILKTAGIVKEEVLIVGDNIFDDLMSSKLLGVKCLLLNNYNSKFKKWVCKTVNSKYL